jgi:hypothetical protein
MLYVTILQRQVAVYFFRDYFLQCDTNYFRAGIGQVQVRKSCCVKDQFRRPKQLLLRSEQKSLYLLVPCMVGRHNHMRLVVHT